MDAGRPAPDVHRRVEQLNESLRSAQSLDAATSAALRQAGFLTIDELASWHTTPAGTDFDVFVARQQAKARP